MSALRLERKAGQHLSQRGDQRFSVTLQRCATILFAAQVLRRVKEKSGWTFAETLDKVEARRKTVYPNVGFQARWRHGEVFTAFRSCRACSWTCGIRV